MLRIRYSGSFDAPFLMRRTNKKVGGNKTEKQKLSYDIEVYVALDSVKLPVEVRVMDDESSQRNGQKNSGRKGIRVRKDQSNNGDRNKDW